MADNSNLDVWLRELPFQGENETYRTTLVACALPSLTSFKEMEDCLHPKEQEYYDSLRFDRRIKSYLLGKYVAKRAVAAYVGGCPLERILIDRGIFNQPMVLLANDRHIQVTVSHSHDLGVAMAFPEAIPIGIDLERMNPAKQTVLEKVMTAGELELAKGLSFPYSSMLTLLWTVKESISKTLKTGLLTPFQVYEVDNIENSDKIFLSRFRNFRQFYSISFFLLDYVCTVTYPSIISFDVGEVQGLLKDISRTTRF